MPDETDPEIFTLLNGDVDPRCQEIEIASSFQIPNFQIIGLPGPEVAEAKDRIRSALEASGFDFPKRKIILNLSPASVRKEGTGLDLAMAVAVLIESWKIEGREVRIPSSRIFAWGELGLDGRVKAVRSPARAIAAGIRARAGILLVAKADESRFRKTARELFSENPVPEIRGIRHFREVEGALQGKPSAFPEEAPLDEFPPTLERRHLLPIPPTTATVLQIAAAGAHHFLLLGPKGVGKSLALEWFLALQPPPETDTTRARRFLAEISGREDELPFRRIGTQVKAAALLGSFAGGSLRPGEFSLAHGGVLLADEFPEWSRDAREALREPLERRRVTLTRVDGVLELPSDFIFAGNGNLCPCGGVPDAPLDGRLPSCRCIPSVRERYLAKIGGPILDRLDLVIRLFAGPEAAEGFARTNAESEFSRTLETTTRARARLVARYGAPPGKLSAERLEDLLSESPGLRANLDAILFRSFRDRHKTLRVALTLAALRGLDVPDVQIFREARALRIESLKSGRPAAGA
jgi:magnesium chelatase family protein